MLKRVNKKIGHKSINLPYIKSGKEKCFGKKE